MNKAKSSADDVETNIEAGFSSKSAIRLKDWLKGSVFLNVKPTMLYNLLTITVVGGLLMIYIVKQNVNLNPGHLLAVIKKKPAIKQLQILGELAQNKSETPVDNTMNLGDVYIEPTSKLADALNTKDPFDFEEDSAFYYMIDRYYGNVWRVNKYGGISRNLLHDDKIPFWDIHPDGSGSTMINSVREGRMMIVNNGTLSSIYYTPQIQNLLEKWYKQNRYIYISSYSDGYLLYWKNDNYNYSDSVYACKINGDSLFISGKYALPRNECFVFEFTGVKLFTLNEDKLLEMELTAHGVNVLKSRKVNRLKSYYPNESELNYFDLTSGANIVLLQRNLDSSQYVIYRIMELNDTSVKPTILNLLAYDLQEMESSTNEIWIFSYPIVSDFIDAFKIGGMPQSRIKKYHTPKGAETQMSYFAQQHASTADNFFAVSKTPREERLRPARLTLYRIYKDSLVADETMNSSLQMFKPFSSYIPLQIDNNGEILIYQPDLFMARVKLHDPKKYNKDLAGLFNENDAPFDVTFIDGIYGPRGINWDESYFKAAGVVYDPNIAITYFTVLACIYLIGLQAVRSAFPEKMPEAIRMHGGIWLNTEAGGVYSVSVKEKLDLAFRNRDSFYGRSNIMLVAGLFTGIAGAIYFWLALNKLLEAHLQWKDVSTIFLLLRAIGIMIFLETFMLFFLKQYRVMFNEYKRYYGYYDKLLNLCHMAEQAERNPNDTELRKAVIAMLPLANQDMHENEVTEKIQEFDKAVWPDIIKTILGKQTP